MTSKAHDRFWAGDTGAAQELLIECLRRNDYDMMRRVIDNLQHPLRGRLPTYHECLDMLYDAFGIPGSQTFRDAVVWIQRNYERRPQPTTIAAWYEDAINRMSERLWGQIADDVLAHGSHHSILVMGGQDPDDTRPVWRIQHDDRS